MPRDSFTFKQFTVKQAHCAMKVGTDGVLLGACPDTGGCRRILDIGTGTGLVALMLAQRTPEAAVDAVEIDAAAACQAAANVSDSPFADRIRVYCADFRRWAVEQALPSYDLIASNPPYFANALRSPDHRRTAARHDDLLPLPELIRLAVTLLADDGRLALILPADAERLLRDLAVSEKLHCISLMHIHSLPNRPPKRLLAELARRPVAPRTGSLVLEEAPGLRSAAYKQLMADFYLYG